KSRTCDTPADLCCGAVGPARDRWQNEGDADRIADESGRTSHEQLRRFRLPAGSLAADAVAVAVELAGVPGLSGVDRRLSSGTDGVAVLVVNLHRSGRW